MAVIPGSRIFRNGGPPEHVVHACIVVLVVAAVTVLRFAGHIDNQTVSIVYGTAVGYAAGRSGTGRPSMRSQDPSDD